MRYKRTDVSCCDGSWKAHQVFGGKVEQEKSAFTNTVVLLKDENMALKKEVDELKQELQHQHQWHQKHVVAVAAMMNHADNKLCTLLPHNHLSLQVEFYSAITSIM